MKTMKNQNSTKVTCIYCHGMTRADCIDADTGKPITEPSYCCECKKEIPVTVPKGVRPYTDAQLEKMGAFKISPRLKRKISKILFSEFNFSKLIHA